MTWNNGDQILLRYWSDWNTDQPTGLYPMTVVEDSPELIALYLAAGTAIKCGVNLDGSPIARNLPYAERYHRPKRIGDSVWHTNSRLMLARPGAAHLFSLFFRARDWRILGWYVDLQRPFARTPLGFDSEDQVLDIVIEEDLSWRWKDEDEFAEAQRLGRFSIDEAQSIRAEGERVIAIIESRNWPFEHDWESWRPDPGWAIPTIPESPGGSLRSFQSAIQSPRPPYRPPDTV